MSDVIRATLQDGTTFDAWRISTGFLPEHGEGNLLLCTAEGESLVPALGTILTLTVSAPPMPPPNPAQPIQMSGDPGDIGPPA